MEMEESAPNLSEGDAAEGLTLSDAATTLAVPKQSAASKKSALPAASSSSSSSTHPPLVARENTFSSGLMSSPTKRVLAASQTSINTIAPDTE